MTELEYLICVASNLAAERQSKSLSETQVAANSAKKAAHATAKAEKSPLYDLYQAECNSSA